MSTDLAGSRGRAAERAPAAANNLLRRGQPSIHTDHLGSGTVITDANGNVTERRKYDSFGQITTDSDMTASPVTAGYTGHEHDAELGLINMKGRIYDPFTRRFLTPDPFVMGPLNPQGLNRFAYVRNNPLNLVDPTGFSGEGGGCDNNCDGGPEGGIVIMPEIVITASAPTTYVNTNANVNQSSSGSFNANGFSASGFNMASLGEGTGGSGGSGNAAISDGRMSGGYYSPDMSGGGSRGGDVQALANQNR